MAIEINADLRDKSIIVAQNGARKLLDLIQSTGKFVYSYNGLTKTKNKGQYNLLRHFGAVWSILLVHHNVAAEPQVLAGAIRAISWALNKYSTIIHNSQFIAHNKYIKLGGNALALLAISQLIRCFINNEYSVTNTYKVKDYLVFVDTAERLANGIYLLYSNSAEFPHKLTFPEMELTDFVSDYYEGEALFALGHWVRTCQLLNSICQIPAIEYNSYQQYPQAMLRLHKFAKTNYGVKFQSHWMLYTLAQSISVRDDVLGELMPYMTAIVDDIIENPEYRQREQSTPIACRSEGLLIALKCFQHFKLPADMQERLLQTIEVNLMLQLKFVQADGGIIKGSKDNTVQIDFIQHGISAFALYALFDQE